MAAQRLCKIAVVLAALSTLAVGAFIARKAWQRWRPAPAQVAESYVSTTFYNVHLTPHDDPVPYPAVRGGGLTKLDARLLLGTGDGHLYLIDPATKNLSAQALNVRAPLNGEEFAKAFGGEYHEPDDHSKYGGGAAPGVQTWRFRVADVLAQSLPDRYRVFASHHYWKAAERCVVVRVSTIDLPRDNPAQTAAQWRTLFETTPCLPMEGENRKLGKNPFKGEEVGGRLALLDERTLLLTVGDMSFTGLGSRWVLAQDPNASYGKTLRIDADSGKSELFTLGHRNPQGLYIDGNGTIWSTEHGEKGGDELNQLHAGTNYGWPRVTYGTEYESYTWPLTAHQGRHEGYAEPVYAWLPSIGVSNLIAITNAKKFPVWQGDLLVGSLATKSLYHIATRGDRVVFVEPIPVGERVRDLIELDDGRLLLWTDTGRLVEVAPAEGMGGAVLFGEKCGGCHAISDGLTHRIGPDLRGVMQRGIAKAEGFSYSPALRAKKGEWTAATLDAFLANPQTFAPGTSMIFTGIEDKAARQTLVQYLETLK